MSSDLIDEAISSGRVPKNITKAYLEENHDASTKAAVILAFVMTTIVVLSRTYARTIIVQRFGLDDGLAVLSLLLLIVFGALCVHLIDLGQGHHEEYLNYIMPRATLRRTEKISTVAHFVYTIALFTCRLSGLAFYYRICSVHSKFKRAVKWLVVLLVASFLFPMALLIFHCHPVTIYWPYKWETDTVYKCLEIGCIFSLTSIISLISDFLVFGIPIAMLRMLDMPRKRKIQLACILLPGMPVIGISTARLIIVIQWQWVGSGTYAPMLTVENWEIAATIIALSVPGLKPLFDVLILRRDPRRSGDTGHMPGTWGSSGRNSNSARNLKHKPGVSSMHSSIHVKKLSSSFSDADTFVENLGPNAVHDFAAKAESGGCAGAPAYDEGGIMVRTDVTVGSDHGSSQSSPTTAVSRVPALTAGMMPQPQQQRAKGVEDYSDLEVVMHGRDGNDRDPEILEERDITSRVGGMSRLTDAHQYI